MSMMRGAMSGNLLRKQARVERGISMALWMTVLGGATTKAKTRGRQTTASLITEVRQENRQSTTKIVAHNNGVVPSFVQTL
jgi:hypothetical protein